jgi:hypothetical protein
MMYRGQVKDGRISLDPPAYLAEGTVVTVMIAEVRPEISRSQPRKPLGQISPLRMPGGSLGDEIVRDRR